MVYRRRSHFEQLVSRIVLSSDPVFDLDTEAEGESHTATLQQVGDLLFVIGNEDDNAIQVRMGEDLHAVTIDGDLHEFDADVVREILIAGSQGFDEVEVLASGDDDRLVVDGDEAVLSSSTYRVLVEDAEIIRVLGNTGDDRVQITDSAGDDAIYLHSTFATYVAGGTTTMKFSGFERVEAFASEGGQDRANFYDSPENDRFVSKHGFSYMVGSTFWNYAKGFERVDGHYRSGGDDQALFYDSSGDDHLIANPTTVQFLVGEETHVAHQFPVTRAFTSTGFDTASMEGQDFVADIVVWEPTTAFLRTTGVTDGSYLATELPADHVPIVATNFAVGFDRIEVVGNDPSDRAELKGSSGDDQYVALPEIVELTTPSAVIEATNFGLVRAFGEGGNDRAHLQDSPGNDRYYGKAEFGFMSGPGFVNYVSGFTVDVVSMAGSDYSEVSEYRAPDDYLILDGTRFLVYGPARNERVINFPEGRGFGEGAIVAAIEPFANVFTLSGAHDNSQLPPENILLEAIDRSDEPIETYLNLDGQIVPLSVLEGTS